MVQTELPTPSNLFLVIVSAIMAAIGKIYFRLSWNKDGAALKRLSTQSRPVIIVFNHTSHLDVPAVALALGMAFMRRMIMPGKKELFQHPATAWFMRQGGAIPLDRDMTDTTTVRVLLRALQQNRVVLMSPEGTRSYDGSSQPFKPGFIKLAHRTHALILPVGIHGAFDAFPRTAKFPRPRKVTVSVGAPVDITGYLPPKPGQTDYEDGAALIQQRVAELAQEGKTTEETAF